MLLTYFLGVDTGAGAGAATEADPALVLVGLPMPLGFGLNELAPSLDAGHEVLHGIGFVSGEIIVNLLVLGSETELEPPGRDDAVTAFDFVEQFPVATSVLAERFVVSFSEGKERIDLLLVLVALDKPSHESIVEGVKRGD